MELSPLSSLFYHTVEMLEETRLIEDDQSTVM